MAENQNRKVVRLVDTTVKSGDGQLGQPTKPAASKPQTPQPQNQSIKK